MLISDAKLEEFIVLYQKHYGVVLGKSEALEKATKLVSFIRIVTEVPSEKGGK